MLRIIVRGQPYNYKIILSEVDASCFFSIKNNARAEQILNRTFEYFNDAIEACKTVFPNVQCILDRC